MKYGGAACAENDNYYINACKHFNLLWMNYLRELSSKVEAVFDHQLINIVNINTLTADWIIENHYKDKNPYVYFAINTYVDFCKYNEITIIYILSKLYLFDNLDKFEENFPDYQRDLFINNDKGPSPYEKDMDQFYKYIIINDYKKLIYTLANNYVYSRYFITNCIIRYSDNIDMYSSIINNNMLTWNTQLDLLDACKFERRNIIHYLIVIEYINCNESFKELCKGNAHDLTILLFNKSKFTLNEGLYYAASYGNQHIIDYMIEQGADDYRQGLNGAFFCIDDVNRINIIKFMLTKIIKRELDQ